MERCTERSLLELGGKERNMFSTHTLLMCVYDDGYLMCFEWISRMCDSTQHREKRMRIVIAALDFANLNHKLAHRQSTISLIEFNILCDTRTDENGHCAASQNVWRYLVSCILYLDGCLPIGNDDHTNIRTHSLSR